MVWVFLLVGGLLVFAVAAGFVGSEAFRLGHTTPPAIFDLDEAVDAVGDSLPPAVQARLTYEEVRQLIRAALDHLRTKGVGALPGEEVRPPTGEDVVVADDDTVAVVLRAVDTEGLDVTDEDAFEVIRGLLTHLERIGAFGPRA